MKKFFLLLVAAAAVLTCNARKIDNPLASRDFKDTRTHIRAYSVADSYDMNTLYQIANAKAYGAMVERISAAVESATEVFQKDYGVNGNEDAVSSNTIRIMITAKGRLRGLHEVKRIIQVEKEKTIENGMKIKKTRYRCYVSYEIPKDIAADIAAEIIGSQLTLSNLDKATIEEEKIKFRNFVLDRYFKDLEE